MAKRSGASEPVPTTVETGSTGLRQYSGHVQEEWLDDLRGPKGIRKYREMEDNDPVIGATLYMTRLLASQTKWTVSPPRGDTSPQAREVADFVESARTDILEEGGWAGFLTNALSMQTFGWSWAEKVYKIRRGIMQPLGEMRSKYDDGRIGWRKLSPRSQESLLHWDLTPQGEVLGWQQLAPSDFRQRSIRREKGLHFRLRPEKNNPEGYSILRPVYRPWYHATNLEWVEAVGIKRNLAGYPVATIPAKFLSPSATAAEKSVADSYQDLVRKMDRDENEGTVMPPKLDSNGMPTGYDLTLLSGGGNRPADSDIVIKRYHSRIAMALLTQFMLLGQDKVGSFALVDSATDLFAVGLGSMLDVIAEEINNNAIPELVELNGWSHALTPVISHGDIETPDLAKLGAFLSASAGVGLIVPDAPMERWVREQIGAPPPDEATAGVASSDGFDGGF